MKLTEQKMIQRTMTIVFIVAGLIFGNVARAQEKFILSMTEFTIKTGHERQFENGIKQWKECYLENKRRAKVNTPFILIICML